MASLATFERCLLLSARSVGEEFREGLLGHRRPDCKALRFVTLRGSKKGEVLSILHAFGEHGDGQALGQSNDRAHDRRRLLAGVEIARNRAVNLELVEGKRLQRR